MYGSELPAYIPNGLSELSEYLKNIIWYCPWSCWNTNDPVFSIDPWNTPVFKLAPWNAEDPASFAINGNVLPFGVMSVNWPVTPWYDIIIPFTWLKLESKFDKYIFLFASLTALILLFKFPSWPPLLELSCWFCPSVEANSVNAFFEHDANKFMLIIINDNFLIWLLFNIYNSNLHQ